MVAEVFEVIPICKSVPKTWGRVGANSLGCEGYQDSGVVRGNCKIRRNIFGKTKIYEIRDFMHVRRPVSRMARGEVG
jgi:hypothetical protein